MERGISGSLPAQLDSRSPPWFPDPGQADDEGLVAMGGDLSAERLLLAYRQGIFPCYGDDTPPLWWSPNPRATIDPEQLHISRRLARRIRNDDFCLSFDQDFPAIIQACGENRSDGRWILPEMVSAYTALHEEGHAHSVEIRQGPDLIGGLYGVRIGRLFAAESMFHRQTDASKVALAIAVTLFFRRGIEIFDVQFESPHLISMGAFTIAREKYLTLAKRATEEPLQFELPRDSTLSTSEVMRSR